MCPCYGQGREEGAVRWPLLKRIVAGILNGSDFFGEVVWEGRFGDIDFQKNNFAALSVGDILQYSLLPAALRNEFSESLYTASWNNLSPHPGLSPLGEGV